MRAFTLREEEGRTTIGAVEVTMGVAVGVGVGDTSEKDGFSFQALPVSMSARSVRSSVFTVGDRARGARVGACWSAGRTRGGGFVSAPRCCSRSVRLDDGRRGSSGSLGERAPEAWLPTSPSTGMFPDGDDEGGEADEPSADEDGGRDPVLAVVFGTGMPCVEALTGVAKTSCRMTGWKVIRPLTSIGR